MQSLVPGLSVSDTLILAEKLPAPPGAVYQVWHALNRQVGQLVIIKVYADGRVEPIENSLATTTPPVSTAPPVSEPPSVSTWNVSPPIPSTSIPASSAPTFNSFVPSTPTPVAQPTIISQNNPFRPTNAPIPQPLRKRNKRWLRYVLTGILLLGVATAGYFYRKPLRHYWRSISRSFQSMIKTLPDSVTKPSSTTPVVEDQRNPDTVTLEPLPPSPTEPKGPPPAPTTVEEGSGSSSATPITAQQAARLLSLMAKIPAEKHPAIFADARQAFTNLRQSSGRQSYIDSLYTVCKGRGAQSVITYQQNGDPVSKRYAIDWYQTAYALKPDTDLRDRIARLTNRAQSKRSKPVRKPAKNTESIFMRDPEVNR